MKGIEMGEYSRFSLLEVILLVTGRKSLRDLGILTRSERRELADRIIADVPVDVPTVQDYNEAIHFLLYQGPRSTVEEARSFLINGLQST